MPPDYPIIIHNYDIWHFIKVLHNIMCYFELISVFSVHFERFVEGSKVKVLLK